MDQEKMTAKRCGCLLSEAPTDTTHQPEDNAVGSECVACGATWSTYDGTSPSFVSWLLDKLLASDIYTARFAMQLEAAPMPEGTITRSDGAYSGQCKP